MKLEVAVTEEAVITFVKLAVAVTAVTSSNYFCEAGSSSSSNSRSSYKFCEAGSSSYSSSSNNFCKAGSSSNRSS